MSPELKYEKASKKSIDKVNKILYEPKKIEIKPEIKKAFAAFFAVALTAALMIGVPKGIALLDRYQDTKAIQTEEMMRVSSKLIDNSLSILPDEHNQWRNNYFEMADLNNDDIYGFYYYFGNSNPATRSELDKVLNVLGYSNMDNFLHMNGYFDSDGNASISVWKNFEEARLMTKGENIK